MLNENASSQCRLLSGTAWARQPSGWYQRLAGVDEYRFRVGWTLTGQRQQPWDKPEQVKPLPTVADHLYTDGFGEVDLRCRLALLTYRTVFTLRDMFTDRTHTTCTVLCGIDSANRADTLRSLPLTTIDNCLTRPELKPHCIGSACASRSDGLVSLLAAWWRSWPYL